MAGRCDAEYRYAPWFAASVAYDINAVGEIVGDAEREGPDGRDEWRAVRWTTGGDSVMDLGTLGGRNSRASAINDRGQIVGTSDLPGGMEGACGVGSSAFLYEGGQMRSLGSLPGYQGSGASDVNNKGDVVGSSANSCSDSRACLWRGTEIYDLNACIPEGSGWELLRIARSINDSGQIVGNGVFAGSARSFLLIPHQ